MAIHHIYAPALDANPLTITGDEAQHAIRVKRLEIGDPIIAFDGQGGRAQGLISLTQKLPRTGEWSLQIDIRDHSTLPRTTPHVQVWTALPKGSRATEMIEGLSEVGAASWSPLHTARSIVESGDHKLAKLQRAAIESSKQCQRPWILEINPGGDLNAALRNIPPGGIVVACHGSAHPLPMPPPTWLRLLVGPEGGWSPQELDFLTSKGVTLARFGPHIMRLETAAVVAAAIALSHS
jgi:16S rRNA (uracil1498-N3)-methyltransferase